MLTVANSKKAASSPVANLHKINVRTFMPRALISGSSCIATLTPPNPQRNAAAMILFLSDANCTPAVTSAIYLTDAAAFVGRHALKSAVAEENTIMYEQTERTEDVLFSTAERNASDSVELSFFASLIAVMFPNITFRISPMTVFAARQAKNSVAPAVIDEKNAPQTDIVKDNPGLTAARHILFASSVERRLFECMNRAFFTPTG